MLNGKGDAERNLNFYLIYEIKTPNSEFTSTAKDSTQREKIPYICGLRTRIECEPVSEHSTHSDRVTDIGSLLSFGTSPLPDKLNKKIALRQMSKCDSIAFHLLS